MTERVEGTRARRGRQGRFTGMTLDELKRLFVEKIGRESGSSDRRYLEWKIREADKGRVRVGPLDRARALPPAEMMTLPWRLPRVTVARIDEARARLNVSTRSALLTEALAEYLTRHGEAETAALVRTASGIRDPE